MSKLPSILGCVMTSLLSFIVRPLESVLTMLMTAPTLDSVLLSLWVAIVGYFRSEILALEMGKMNVVLLLAAMVGVMWSDSVFTGTRGAYVWRRNYVQHSLHFVIYVSLPVVLLFYVWQPLKELAPCAVRAVWGRYAWLAMHAWRPLTLGAGAALLLYLLSTCAKKTAGARRQAALSLGKQTTQATPPAASCLPPCFSTPLTSPSRLRNTPVHTPITRSMTTRMLRSQDVAWSSLDGSGTSLGGRTHSSRAAHTAHLRSSTAHAEQSTPTERRAKYGTRAPTCTTLDT